MVYGLSLVCVSSQKPNDPLDKPAGFKLAQGVVFSQKPKAPLGKPAGFRHTSAWFENPTGLPGGILGFKLQKSTIVNLKSHGLDPWIVRFLTSIHWNRNAVLEGLKNLRRCYLSHCRGFVCPPGLT
jgi:hypothetical protein